MEIQELKDELNEGAWTIHMLVQDEDQTDHASFQKVLQELPYSFHGLFSPQEQYQIQVFMGIGDARLPLAVVLDGNGNGVYACANYNIRSVHTMLRILKMIST